MSTIVINWHTVWLVILALAVGAALLLGLVSVLLHLRKGSTSSTPSAGSGTSGDSLLSEVQNEVKQFAATPVGKTVIADAEKLAELVAAKIKGAPPVNIPNHPALTAVADVLQKAAQTEAALAKVSAAVSEANSVAQTATSPTPAPPAKP